MHLDPSDAARQAAAQLDGAAPSVRELRDADLVALVGVVEHLGRAVDALRVRVAGEVAFRSCRADDAALADRYGCRTGTELLERLTGASSRELRGRARLDESTRTRTALTGEDLAPRLEHVAAGLASGLLGMEAAAGIMKAVDTARRGGGDPERVELMERHLVAIATGTIDPDAQPGDGADDEEGRSEADPLATLAPVPPLSVVNLHAQAWIDVLTADGAEPDHDGAMRQRSLTLTPLPSGAFRINGVLVPEAGALLQALLSAHTNPARNVRFTSDGDVRGESDGGGAGEGGEGGAAQWPEVELPPPDAMPDTRSATQKRHDALMAMLEAASRAAETPSLGGAAPTVMVHVSADDLARQANASGAAFTRPVAHLDGVDAPVPLGVAERIGCTGDILRAVFTAEGRLLSLSSVQRIFTATQRKAIVARDGGCVIPGCTIPAAWCEIHHVQDYAQGGPTTTDNGVLLCWWHHHHLEQSGWAIRMRGGVPYLAPPAWIDRACRPRPAQGSATRLRSRLRRTLVSRRT
ncbi:HNH endonuclease signature motif containing protein [Microbacterium oryzae]